MTMPTYEIEQYEICLTKYRVEASSEAEAIAMLLDGEADAIDNSHEYVEIAEDCGLRRDRRRSRSQRQAAQIGSGRIVKILRNRSTTLQNLQLDNFHQILPVADPQRPRSTDYVTTFFIIE